MVRKWAIKIPAILLLAIMITTVLFGLLKTKSYSAYAECRKVAAATKGYGVWKHERTFQMVFTTQIIFSDGYNELNCEAVGIGPFWTVRGSGKTLVACVESLDDLVSCPEDYFGVIP